jgi:hypothetical protein
LAIQALPPVLAKTVPEELKSFAKVEVSFFMEKIPNVLK